jgi:manganese/iron transport system ATP-binding protein
MKADQPVELQVNDVTVSYANGMVALRDASFRLTGGAICGLVGVNGSGKSTLFKAIMGFVRPMRGTVLIGGRSGARGAQAQSGSPMCRRLRMWTGRSP